MGDGEDEKRGQTLGYLSEDDSNGSQDMGMIKYEGINGEGFGEERDDDTLMSAQFT